MRRLRGLVLIMLLMFSASSLYAEEPKKVDGKTVHEVPTEKGATLAHTVAAGCYCFLQRVFRGAVEQH